MTGPSETYPLLSSLHCPADLRGLPTSTLSTLATELREFLIRSVSLRVGHFAAGLGTVELTIALHYVFDTPHDRLVWDVGRRCLQGDDRRFVAVVGDGALAAGMAFEALNHAGSMPTDPLVVLNDNNVSISENVGALSKRLQVRQVRSERLLKGIGRGTLAAAGLDAAG
jgi:1-deoxy-D-xylulose-5-phosphate synthase